MAEIIIRKRDSSKSKSFTGLLKSKNGLNFPVVSQVQSNVHVEQTIAIESVATHKAKDFEAVANTFSCSKKSSKRVG